MVKQYKNPPVIEAIFEIRFPAELSIECNKDDYYEKIRAEYPNIFVPIIDTPEPYPLKNYKFENEEMSKVIQFSINKFSVHLRKYTTFSKFEEEVLKYMNLFCKLYKIKNINRTGLRYINEIALQRENNIIPIDKYLNFGFSLPGTVPNDLELFHTILLTKLDDGKLQILIKTGKSEKKGEVIVLDFDFYFEGDLSVTKLNEYIRKSHHHTKRTFEALISKEFKKSLIKGGG